MAILAGNLASKVLSGRQAHIFSRPWVKTERALLCFKGMCSSSVPVRYIPNKPFRKIEPDISVSSKGFQTNDEFMQSSRGAEKRSIIPRDEKSASPNPTRNNYVIGGLKKVEQYATDSEQGMDHRVAVVEHELMDEPEEVDEENGFLQGEGKQNDKAMQDVERVAIRMLAMRAYTAVEMKKKLDGKKFPPNTVEAVVNDFQSRGLLNDSLYAETFAQSRFSSSSWGPRRIKQALVQKGVTDIDAEKAVELVFKHGESDEDSDSDSNPCLSKLAMDHLFVRAVKQWLRGKDVPKETRKSRIIRWLQYRGFNWSVISIILKKLEAQYPS